MKNSNFRKSSISIYKYSYLNLRVSERVFECFSSEKNTADRSTRLFSEEKHYKTFLRKMLRRCYSNIQVEEIKAPNVPSDIQVDVNIAPKVTSGIQEETTAAGQVSQVRLETEKTFLTLWEQFFLEKFQEGCQSYNAKIPIIPFFIFKQT